MERTPFSALEITDESSFGHVSLYADLKSVAARANLQFLVGRRRERALSISRTLLLNLLFWEPGTSDILSEPTLPADVVMHVVWHHLGAQRVGRGGDADLFVEAIASAFDLYLVGRLLGHRPDAEFLESQVPRMADAAEDAGMEPDEFEALLEMIASDPEQAFESMRRLLFDATRALVDAASPDRADATLRAFEDQPFGVLLHHFEVATWVSRARLDRATAGDEARAATAEAERIDAILRQQKVSLDWLDEHWVRGAIGDGRNA